MHLTISSVLTGCFFVSVMALILILLFKSERVMGKIGPQYIIVAFLAIIIRMFITPEFFYTYSVRIEKILPGIRMLLIRPVVTKPAEICVWHILCAIWAIGIIVSVASTVRDYKNIKILGALICREEAKVSVDERTLELCPEVAQMTIVTCKGLPSPYLFGLIHPKLFLPDADYSERQLQYILLHEGMHIRNKDIIWKILIDLLCKVFWWNPVFLFLKRELFRAIEMRNDIAITDLLTDEEQVQYMECLRDTAIQTSKKEVSFGVALSNSDVKELKRRLKLIAGRNFSKVAQVATLVVLCMCLFATTTVIFEPHKMPSTEELDGAVLLVPGNTYLIINGDQYDVYVDGEFLFTTDDLAPFPGVNIYQNLKEAQEHEEKGTN